MVASAMYFSLAGCAICASEPEKMAAVALSAATTSWREEPKMVKPASGSSTV